MKNIYFFVVVILTFTSSYCKLEEKILKFFNFKEDNVENIEDQVNHKKLTRMEGSGVMTMDLCKESCFADASCRGAVYSEIDSIGCDPDTCTDFYGRGIAGVCHRLKYQDDGVGMDFRSELEGKRRNSLLFAAHLCYPGLDSPDTEVVRDAPIATDVTVEPKNGNSDVTCFVFSYTCPLGYHLLDESMADATVRCCDEPDAEKVSLNLFKCMKSPNGTDTDV